MTISNLPFAALGTSDMDRSIAAIARSGPKLDARIQSTALAAAYHLSMYQGGSQYMTRLLGAMPKGSRVDRLCAWFNTHFPLRVKRQKDGTYKVTVFRFRKEADGSLRAIKDDDWHWNAATETMWHQKGGSAAPKEQDVEAFVKRLASLADDGSKVARTESLKGLAAELLESPEFLYLVTKWGAAD